VLKEMKIAMPAVDLSAIPAMPVAPRRVVAPAGKPGA